MTSKIDKKKIVEDLRSLYAKDKKTKSIVSLGNEVKTAYTKEDLVPIPADHPLRELIGLPGIPYNKIVQVAGKKDTGKSTFAAQTMVEAQKAGITVILLDSEDKFDSNRFIKMGGDPEQILLIKTNEILKGNEAVRRIITAIKEQEKDARILFVWDSVGASQSRSHAERELDDEKHAQPGQDAKENGSVMKTIVALMNKYPDSIAVFLVNQTYAKIGFMMKGDQASGGAKIEYHSSLIIMLKSIKTLTKVVKGVTRKVGIISRATVTKNHLSQLDSSIHQLDFEVDSMGARLTTKSTVEDAKEREDQDGDEE